LRSFYYGAIFPNTAYAKLNTGLISQAELWQQGGIYFANSLAWDPVTLGAVGLAVLVVVYWRQRQDWPCCWACCSICSMCGELVGIL
jgi:hypothetical protein